MKRENPFVDADLLAQVTNKVKANASEYAVKIQEEMNTDALSCTFLHIGIRG